MGFLLAHTNEILIFLTISILLICIALYYALFRLFKNKTKKKVLKYVVPLLIVIALLLVVPFTREFISYFLFNRINITIPKRIIF